MFFVDIVLFFLLTIKNSWRFAKENLMLSVKNLVKIYKQKGAEPVKALNNVSIDFPETGLVACL
jgi:ABC-type glutathione transport system ATPase component